MSNPPSFGRKALRTLQVNVGKICNMRCSHCHVDAGPHRKEAMSDQVVQRVVELLDRFDFQTLDITGGAPELNPHFKTLVMEGRKRSMEVIDRCNLSVLLIPGNADLLDFLVEFQVHIVASLPCYSQKNVDLQRGEGAFAKSIEAIKRLNQAGYGKQDDLVLDFIYNPSGPFLAGDQASLQADYKQRLWEDFEIEFNHLYTLHNFPVGRWAEQLKKDGEYESYLSKLKEAYNSATIEGLMCRDQLSIGYTGEIFDCDFHQMEEIPTRGKDGRPLNLIDGFEDEELFTVIPWRPHCFACTAGSGASCSGALV